ncbi:MAG: hypothetical protein EXS64_15970 [Candidatus Latescibacteria bacterium]|nr:hypothetical protein [Candidatus Latescibacterota bacterium]
MMGVAGGVLICSSLTGAGEVRGRVEVRSRTSAGESGPGGGYGHGGAFEGKSEPKPEFSEAQSVVLFVEVKDSLRYSPPAAHPRVTQRAKTFIPPVLPVLVGTTVDFPNEDTIYHNVFSYAKPKRLELGRYPPGSSRSVTFDKSGVVKLFCEIHENMSAYILVLGTPFFTVPDREGEFVLRNLSPGRHRIKVWHPTLPRQEREVFVPESGVVEVNFEL